MELVCEKLDFEVLSAGENSRQQLPFVNRTSDYYNIFIANNATFTHTSTKYI